MVTRTTSHRGLMPLQIVLVVLTVVTLFLLTVPYLLAEQRQENEALLRTRLVAIRSAIQQYHRDTQTYPRTLQDLVETDRTKLPAAVQSRYWGPYLSASDDINCRGYAGIPTNPFTRTTETNIGKHWKYHPKYGRIIVPESQQDQLTIHTRERYGDL